MFFDFKAGPALSEWAFWCVSLPRGDAGRVGGDGAGSPAVSAGAAPGSISSKAGARGRPRVLVAGPVPGLGWRPGLDSRRKSRWDPGARACARGRLQASVFKLRLVVASGGANGGVGPKYSNPGDRTWPELGRGRRGWRLRLITARAVHRAQNAEVALDGDASLVAVSEWQPPQLASSF